MHFKDHDQCSDGSPNQRSTDVSCVGPTAPTDHTASTQQFRAASGAKKSVLGRKKWGLTEKQASQLMFGPNLPVHLKRPTRPKQAPTPPSAWSLFNMAHATGQSEPLLNTWLWLKSLREESADLTETIRVGHPEESRCSSAVPTHGPPASYFHQHKRQKSHTRRVSGRGWTLSSPNQRLPKQLRVKKTNGLGVQREKNSAEDARKDPTWLQMTKHSAKGGRAGSFETASR